MYRVILSVFAAAVFVALQFAAPTQAQAAGGIASYYGYDFAGKPTANGERYNPMGMTAASRSLPFGTIVRVTNRNNGRSVVVRINDRGPFVGGRVIDMSQGAAGVIGMIGSGVAPVDIQIVGSGSRTQVASNSPRKHRTVHVAARSKRHYAAVQVASLKRHKPRHAAVQVAVLKKHKRTSVAASSTTTLKAQGYVKVKPAADGAN